MRPLSYRARVLAGDLSDRRFNCTFQRPHEVDFLRSGTNRAAMRKVIEAWIDMESAPLAQIAIVEELENVQCKQRRDKNRKSAYKRDSSRWPAVWIQVWHRPARPRSNRWQDTWPTWRNRCLSNEHVVVSLNLYHFCDGSLIMTKSVCTNR